MSRRCFAAVNDDLLRARLTLMVRLLWLALLLLVDNLWGMWLLNLHLPRLTFVVGYHNLVGHPRRHGNISHLMKIRRNVDQQISTSWWMMHCRRVALLLLRWPNFADDLLVNHHLLWLHLVLNDDLLRTTLLRNTLRRHILRRKLHVCTGMYLLSGSGVNSS